MRARRGRLDVCGPGRRSLEKLARHPWRTPGRQSDVPPPLAMAVVAAWIKVPVGVCWRRAKYLDYCSRVGARERKRRRGQMVVSRESVGDIGLRSTSLDLVGRASFRGFGRLSACKDARATGGNGLSFVLADAPSTCREAVVLSARRCRRECYALLRIPRQTIRPFRNSTGSLPCQILLPHCSPPVGGLSPLVSSYNGHEGSSRECAGSGPERLLRQAGEERRLGGLRNRVAKQDVSTILRVIAHST
jgi:hypothetical protein